MKQQKYFNKAIHKLGKIGGIIGNKSDLETSEHFIGLNIGDSPPKSFLGALILTGAEAKQLNNEICKDFEDINENTVCIVIRVRTTDA